MSEAAPEESLQRDLRFSRGSQSLYMYLSDNITAQQELLRLLDKDKVRTASAQTH